jgi:hypothetical protein
VASQNARTHGLLSSCVVVDWSDFENAENFWVLREGLSKDLQPEGALEELYVEKIAVGFWRLQRMWGFERHNTVHALKEGIHELVAKKSTDRDERVKQYVTTSLWVSHDRTKARTLRAAMDKLGSGLLGDVGLDEAVSAAIEELDHAPSRAEPDSSLQLIYPEDGGQAVKPDEKERLTREYAELRNDLASSLNAHSQGRMSDDDFVHSIEGIYGAMGIMLERAEESLETLENVQRIAEERWKDKTPLYGEEEATEFLKGYIGPPLDGLDVYVRYETSVERRLQKDIETLYALQAIRRGSGRKLLGAGAIQS